MVCITGVKIHSGGLLQTINTLTVSDTFVALVDGVDDVT